MRDKALFDCVGHGLLVRPLGKHSTNKLYLTFFENKAEKQSSGFSVFLDISAPFKYNSSIERTPAFFKHPPVHPRKAFFHESPHFWRCGV
jgi:hypothetical protein